MSVARPWRVPAPTVVYVLGSTTDLLRYDTGLTSDVARRLAAHNRRESTHTRTGTPWELVVSVAFADVDHVASRQP